jgi:hypothetical protein
VSRPTLAVIVNAVCHPWIAVIEDTTISTYNQVSVTGAVGHSDATIVNTLGISPGRANLDIVSIYLRDTVEQVGDLPLHAYNCLDLSHAQLGHFNIDCSLPRRVEG